MQHRETSTQISWLKLSKKTHLDDKWFLNALLSSFTDLKNWRNLARIKISHLNKSKLKHFSWIFVELSNDCETNYPREIIDLVLDMINFRLFHLKKSNTKKNMDNYIKVYFQARDIEEVRLSSILHKHLPSIPSFFLSKDSPTVLYSRSPHIGSTIFNYKKVVDAVITSDWKEDNSNVCNCSKSEFCDPHHGHIVTGNLNVIENRQLRNLMLCGPGYREPQKVKWPAFLKNFKISLKKCVKNWAQRENVDDQVLQEWYDKVMEDVSKAVKRLSKKRKKNEENDSEVSFHFKNFERLTERVCVRTNG